MGERLKLDRTAVEWRHVEGEIVALDLRDSMYLAVNGSGALLWRELEDGATRGDLIATLVSEFDLEEERAADDVDAFLDSLRGRDLLEP